MQYAGITTMFGNLGQMQQDQRLGYTSAVCVIRLRSIHCAAWSTTVIRAWHAAPYTLDAPWSKGPDLGKMFVRCYTTRTTR